MQTFSTFAAILTHITLPNAWELEFTACPDFMLRVVDPNGRCNVTGNPLPWKGRKWVLSKWMTDGEVVQTAFMAVLAAVEHEVRESFLYKGYAILDPHYNIEKLVALRQRPDAIKERDPIAG